MQGYNSKTPILAASTQEYTTYVSVEMNSAIWTYLTLVVLYLIPADVCRKTSSRKEPTPQTADTMDAIRKKMKSLKDETDQLYAIIQRFA